MRTCVVTKIERDFVNAGMNQFQMTARRLSFSICLFVYFGFASLGLFIKAGFATEKQGQKRFNYYRNLTGDDPETDQNRWDALYNNSKDYMYGRDPAPFLVENLKLLPKEIGRASCRERV